MFSTTEAEEVLVSEESVKGSVGLASLAHEASEGDDGVLGAGHLAVFVNLGNLDLHGSVVLGGDESVSGGALAGDV